MQAAAMGGVDRWNAQQTRGEPPIEPALGTMTVNDIRLQLAGMGHGLPDTGKIAKPRQAGDRNAGNAEPAVGGCGVEQLRRRLSTRGRVAQDADIMALSRLAPRHIAQREEQAADGEQALLRVILPRSGPACARFSASAGKRRVRCRSRPEVG